MESMVSSTLLMKHADACGLVPWTPTLNHTGLLKDIIWCRTRWLSSSWYARASSSLAKYPPWHPQPAMVSQTREMTCLTLVSRRGDPRGPRKYLLTTTLVAICDQDTGTSTSRCSKTVSPFSLEMDAV